MDQNNNNSKKIYVVEYDYGELEAATDNFSSSLLIGKGSHGCVYKGILVKERRPVAIKKQSLGLQKLQDNSKLENEALILSSLPKSPHLINLLGTSHDHHAQNKVLVMQFMPNGSLHDLLHNLGSTPPTWSTRARVAVQVARAVNFLHEADPLIIHRDIKSANILFDSDWTAKLADFGLAVSLEAQRADSASRPAGTIGYLDPCYDTPCRLSTKNDVFSFGVVLLEIISGTKAIDFSRVRASIVEWALELIAEERVAEIWDKRALLTLHGEGTIRRMTSIAARCVSSREDERPSMGEVVMEIEKCLLEPVRAPIWIDVLRGVLKRKWKIIAKRRKCACNSTRSMIIPAAAAHDGKGNGEFPKGKIMLLREVLADITLK